MREVHATVETDLLPEEIESVELRRTELVYPLEKKERLEDDAAGWVVG